MSETERIRQVVGQMQNQLDTRAIEMANRAMGRLDQHLAAYEEAEKRRHEERVEQNRALAELRSDLKHGFEVFSNKIQELHDSVTGRWMRLMMTLIFLMGGALIGLVVWIYTNGFIPA